MSYEIDPLKPPTALLVKLGSIAVHFEELMSPRGHPFDRAAIDTLLADWQVREWLRAMDNLALLPKKRA